MDRRDQSLRLNARPVCRHMQSIDAHPIRCFCQMRGELRVSRPRSAPPFPRWYPICGASPPLSRPAPRADGANDGSGGSPDQKPRCVTPSLAADASPCSRPPTCAAAWHSVRSGVVRRRQCRSRWTAPGSWVRSVPAKALWCSARRASPARYSAAPPPGRNSWSSMRGGSTGWWRRCSGEGLLLRVDMPPAFQIGGDEAIGGSRRRGCRIFIAAPAVFRSRLGRRAR